MHPDLSESFSGGKGCTQVNQGKSHWAPEPWRCTCHPGSCGGRGAAAAAANTKFILELGRKLGAYIAQTPFLEPPWPWTAPGSLPTPDCNTRESQACFAFSSCTNFKDGSDCTIPKYSIFTVCYLYLPTRWQTFLQW